MQILNRLRPHPPSDETGGSVNLIVGLGNPGRQYIRNRHNIGFRVVDHYAHVHAINFGKMQHNAMLALGRNRETRIILAKPQSFMNDSGRAVSALLKFYKVPIEKMLVIYDELDLPFGAIRLRQDGGAGGHNGMRSIITQLGGNNFPRLRIGIGRPPGRMDPAAFVLQDFNKDETIEVEVIVDRAIKAIDTFIVDGIAQAMNQFNSTGDKAS
jgi:PTH1 family peptidyl-tRNA hydrolase